VILEEKQQEYRDIVELVNSLKTSKEGGRRERTFKLDESRGSSIKNSKHMISPEKLHSQKREKSIEKRGNANVPLEKI